MRQTRVVPPSLSTPSSFPADAKVSFQPPTGQARPAPLPRSLDDLGYSQEHIDRLIEMAHLEQKTGVTVSAGPTLGALLTRVNATDVRPPYQYGANPDLDLFLEANMVDFPEGTPMSELHLRLQETFTAVDEADLIQEGLALAFKPSSRRGPPFTICLDELYFYGGKGPSPELFAEVEALNRQAYALYEQEEAAFTQALVEEAQALPAQDPRRPGVLRVLSQWKQSR